MYNPKSKNATEFIDDKEVRDAIAYADDHKNDVELIDKILEKARKRKGLNYREASVLLACENEEKNKEILDLAKQIKKRFLWKQNCFVCSALLVQLLHKRLSLLSIPC